MVSVYLHIHLKQLILISLFGTNQAVSKVSQQMCFKSQPIGLLSLFQEDAQKIQATNSQLQMVIMQILFMEKVINSF